MIPLVYKGGGCPSSPHQSTLCAPPWLWWELKIWRFYQIKNYSNNFYYDYYQMWTSESYKTHKSYTTRLYLHKIWKVKKNSRSPYSVPNLSSWSQYWRQEHAPRAKIGLLVFSCYFLEKGPFLTTETIFIWNTALGGSGHFFSLQLPSSLVAINLKNLMCFPARDHNTWFRARRTAFQL